MRNVYFIRRRRPWKMWLEKWHLSTCVSSTPASPRQREQRRTRMDDQRNQLADFLDPARTSAKRVEGYPAPLRAVIIATKLETSAVAGEKRDKRPLFNGQGRVRAISSYWATWMRSKNRLTSASGNNPFHLRHRCAIHGVASVSHPASGSADIETPGMTITALAKVRIYPRSCGPFDPCLKNCSRLLVRTPAPAIIIGTPECF